jgi:secreted trypsin-like serine protease
VLTKVKLAITSNSECSQYYPENWKLENGLKDTQLCAVDPIMDTCQGDSGGPLQIELYANGKMIPFLAGLTSYGSSACGSEIPSVYTRISSYIPWIEEIVNKTFDPLGKKL